MKRLSDRIRGCIGSKLARTVTSVATDERIVALTFDDGPDPDVTPRLLRILAAHGAKATFFMIGENAAACPDLVDAVRCAGHALSNHSWDHPSFPLISGWERRRQVSRCSAVLRMDHSRLLRPPYGHQSVSSQWDAWLTGHGNVAWSVAVRDWEEHDGEWLANFALERVRPGSVILMHDGIFDSAHELRANRESTLNAVERILTALSGKYEFLTVPELLRRVRPVWMNWSMEPDIGFLNQLHRKSGPTRRFAQPPGSGR
jgi:peptidoglycan/xylan/chitin deacetylase (PgdA/CDA1 family)